MNRQELVRLLDKYLDGTASDEETQLLLDYYNSFQQAEEWNESELGSRQEMESRILSQLMAAINEQQAAPILPFYKRTWVKAAAVFILIIGAAVWWTANKKLNPPVAKIEVNRRLQNLNSRQATLVLADGSSIPLDGAANGVLAHEGNAVIKKQGDKVIFEVPDRPYARQTSLAYNTVSIPRGRQYQVVLPDGSTVWLNAASVLRFPTAFTGQERRVDIAGEAYFEVAKEPARPFRVYASPLPDSDKKGTLVEVLGTHFNISAYGDESAMRTTLLEGSVKITVVEQARPVPHDSHILLPGQQAQLRTRSVPNDTISIQDVDVAAVVAWKNNVFSFNMASIETIMRQIARWYDVEVVYEGNIPERTFSGKISRNTNLSTVLKILEQSNIHFRVEGKRIIVTS